MRFRDILLAAAQGASGAVYYYVDSVNGSDSNDGKSTTTAFASLSALSGKFATHVGIAKGSVLVSDSFAPNNGGMTFFAYGSGNNPVFRNATTHSSGSWTNVSGNIYSMDTASSYSGSSIWWDASAGAGTEGQVTHLLKGTAGSLTANQWAISNGKLQVNIGQAPTANDYFEVPNSGSGLFLLNGINNLTFRGLSLRYSPSSGVEMANTAAVDNTWFDDCEFAYCNSNLLHGGTGAAWTNGLVTNCYFHDQYNIQNAVAHHTDVAAGNSRIIGCTFRRIAGKGVTSAETAEVYVYNSLFDGARYLVIGGGVGSKALHTIQRCQFVNAPPEAISTDLVIECHTTLDSTTPIKIFNCSLASGVMPVQHRGIYHGGGTLEIRNVSMWGNYSIWLRGFDDYPVGAALRTSSNLAVRNQATASFNWSSAGSATPATGTDYLALVADPYTSVATNNLSPAVGSVLIGAGVAVAGITTGSPPDIGYTGAQ